MPLTLQSVACMGVLDGDQRDRYSGADKRVLFLPGDKPPEVALRGFVDGIPTVELAALLGESEGLVVEAIGRADGQDLHEWPASFAKHLHMNRGELLRKLVIGWAKANLAEATGFVESVEKFSSGNA